MKKTNTTLLLIFSICIFSSCDFINNTLTYKETTKNFIDNIIIEDYDSSLSNFALENENFKDVNLDSLKNGLKISRSVIVDNFGKELDYTFITSEKTFSTVEGEGTEPNTTKAQIQFANSEKFGIFELTFDDNSNKIIHIRMLDLEYPIPNMVPFWLTIVFPISILLFNIYAIRKIKKSTFKKKGLKYFSILFFNFPAFTYNAITGVSIEYSFQILFGISFEYMGYLNTSWTIGIPLGAIYWLLKIRKTNRKIEEQNDTTIGNTV